MFDILFLNKWYVFTLEYFPVDLSKLSENIGVTKGSPLRLVENPL